MPFRVDVIESERGWGTKVDFRRYFNELHHAKEYVYNFNKDNPKGYVPDWYMQAENPVFIEAIPPGQRAEDEGLLL